MSRTAEGELRARQVIQDIVDDHGFVQESTLQSMSRDARLEVERALLAKDRRTGSCVLTLATNLYTSQERCIFELLQNADDNQYTRGQDPYVEFRVCSDQIVIECNEDGFTRQNIEAICDIGESSKTGSQGYIGEKGIGFKSVFMAAWRVHIQSGYFSFEFVHRKGDSGMGMITPRWQEKSDPSLPFGLTRITLYLHDENDPAERERNRRFINNQFHNLQDATLLFLRKLRRIKVSFHDEQGNQNSGVNFTLRELENSKAVVIERKDTDPAKDRKRTYHIFKHIARGLARSESRNLAISGKVDRSSTTSEIVLAFPVIEDPVTMQEVPVVEPQEVFAFLPVKKMGFNFLIQADFVTQANRQDIVMTSRRNQRLVEAIADAFTTAVLQLCHYQVLEYRWMRYLPMETTYPWDGLWSDLVSSIKSKIEDLAVFRSLETGARRTIKDLFYRKPMFNDVHGAPLFADLRSEVYLSDSYAPLDIAILKNFGLKKLPYDKFIALVRQDLLAGPSNSRIKSLATDDAWNSKAYKALSTVWANGRSSTILSLEQLHIIPLQDGSWVSSDYEDIYCPMYEDAAVPKDLGMRLVHPMAMRNENRRAFLHKMGVQPIDISIACEIRERILHQPMDPPTVVSLRSSVERMRFLFLTQLVHPEEDCDMSNMFPVYNQVDEAMYSSDADMYISNDDPYGAELFLRQEGRRVNCVNERYFEEIPSIAPGSNRTLHQWMYQYLGIRQHLRLVSSDGSSLSAECLDTARTRRAEFLGFLGHLWPLEVDIVLANPSALHELRKTRVLCINGEKSQLRHTYLPLQPLLDVHKRFLGSEHFPFIQSSELSGQDQVPHLWSFLVKNLGVGFVDNVDFRLQLMKYLKGANPDAEILSNPSRVVDLYQSLDACLRMSQDSEAKARKIRMAFGDHKLILVPQWKSKKATWTSPISCLWDAPCDFKTKVPLKAIYTSSFNSSSTELSHIMEFFRNTVSITDVGWDDVVEELEELKQQQSITSEVAKQLFGIIAEKPPTDEYENEEMRESFEREALIYFDHTGTPGWHKPSDCVWSDTTHIHGKIAINSQYSDLKDLFVGKLQVPELDLTMVLDQLLAARSLNIPASEVKELLKTLNSFLRTEATPPRPNRLLNARVFPIREPSSGNVILCKSDTEFALVDREGPPSRFIGLIKVLDFTLQEIRQLKPLIAWAGLESRYLSRCLSEISCLGDGLPRPISQPHRDLKKKAYALLRITAAFDSPRYAADPTGLYQVLRTATTLECGVISSSLSLEQDGTTHEIHVGESELHIDDTDTLKIYIPSDRESQDCCFKYDLPHRFASWMMTDPTTGTQSKIEDGTVNVINSILNCLNSTVGRILEKEGIPDIDEIAETSVTILEADELAEQGATSPVAADLDRQREVILSRTPSQAQREERLPSLESTGSPPETPGSQGDTENVPGHPTPLTDPEDYNNGDDSHTPNLRGSIPPPHFNIPEQHASSQYRQLLERVVALGSRTSLPNNFRDISTAFQGLSVGDDPFDGVRYDYNPREWEHRKELGAAGELFVYTILSSIQDLEFDLGNWRSSIRGHARVLPEYQNLRAWPERETSDLVYEDVNGVFTRLMISLGYMNADHWARKTPRYYIEVKCTTGACETPCIVSQNQVDLMESATNGPHGNENQDVVYALFRVFNLGRSSMGLKIYVDPAEQRRLGKLSFTSENYAVTPTGH